MDSNIECLHFFLLIFTISLYSFRIFTMNETKVKKAQFKYDLYSPSFLINCITYSIGFTIIFTMDILHKDNIVLFILKLQTIHKNIDFSKNIWSYIICNFISTATMICIHICLTYTIYDPAYPFDIGYIRD